MIFPFKRMLPPLYLCSLHSPLPCKSKYFYFRGYSTLPIGTIWAVEQRWLKQLQKGSITIKEEHFMVTKLDAKMQKLFGSKANSFHPKLFDNDKNSIFRDEETIASSLLAAQSQTTKNNVETGLLTENLKQIRYLREQLVYHQYMPVMFMTNAIFVLYFFLSKVIQKLREYKQKKQLQKAIQLRQEREILLQQLRA